MNNLPYHRFVAEYLASALGRSTPNSVAKALLGLDPAVCGFDRRPSAKRLHAIRVVIESVHARERSTGLVTRPPAALEESGAVPVGRWPERDSELG